MGPMPMGDTSDLNGLWQIVHRLLILIEWGKNEYSQWFQDNVMSWAKKTWLDIEARRASVATED